MLHVLSLSIISLTTQYQARTSMLLISVRLPNKISNYSWRWFEGNEFSGELYTSRNGKFSLKLSKFNISYPFE